MTKLLIINYFFGNERVPTGRMVNDICEEFVNICKTDKGLVNINHADILNYISEYEEKYDLVMSIAVIHHLRTNEERLEAVCNIVRYMKPTENSKCMFTVWSYEKRDSKVQKKLEQGDNLVPWKNAKGKVENMRFYYVYNEPMLNAFLKEFTTKMESEFDKTYTVNYYWEQQNWVVTIKK